MITNLITAWVQMSKARHTQQMQRDWAMDLQRFPNEATVLPGPPVILEVTRGVTGGINSQESMLTNAKSFSRQMLLGRYGPMKDIAQLEAVLIAAAILSAWQWNAKHDRYAGAVAILAALSAAKLHSL